MDRQKIHHAHIKVSSLNFSWMVVGVSGTFRWLKSVRKVAFFTFQNSRYNSVLGRSKLEQENCVDIVNASEFFSNNRDKTRDPIFTEFLQLRIRAIIVAVTWEMSPSKAFELSPYFRSC